MAVSNPYSCFEFTKGLGWTYFPRGMTSVQSLWHSQQGLSTGGDNVQFWLCPSPPGPLHLLLPQSHSTLRKAAVPIYECLLYERLVVREAHVTGSPDPQPKPSWSQWLVPTRGVMLRGYATQVISSHLLHSTALSTP
jgi:hypothetical protein